MSIIGLPATLDRALGDPCHRCDHYTRYCVVEPLLPLFAQVVVIPSTGRWMNVRAAGDVLDVDFRYESTRSDVPGRLRPRPGFRLVEELEEARSAETPRLLFNGNNIGYWGNQFVIQSGRTVCKPRGPIFDDRALEQHAHGSFTFFCWSPSAFGVEVYDLRSFTSNEADSGVSVLPLCDEAKLPVSGVSGFPLVREGQPVWSDHVEQAWDPRLLFDVGRLTGVDRSDVLRDIRERHTAGEALMRHPLTAAGVDQAGNAIILVAEQSRRSAGLSVAEAAEIMKRIGARDAIALGAAGDAQLATTEEGFLVSPLVDDHVQQYSREIARRYRSSYLQGMTPSARPVPCLVSIESWDAAANADTQVLPVVTHSNDPDPPTMPLSQVVTR